MPTLQAAHSEVEYNLARISRYGDRRALRIGILGGSFNPGHRGHLHIARTALARLRLDQVWLLVSPGNPLKPAAGMAPLPARLASAAALAAAPGAGRRLVPTDLERALGTRYTVDTLRLLRRRFPRARFVFLMGADNLAQMPRWRRWRAILRLAPVAVLPRPSYTRAALAGRAARALRRFRLPARQAPALARRAPPAWIMLPAREHPESATALRRAALAVMEADGTRPPMAAAEHQGGTP